MTFELDLEIREGFLSFQISKGLEKKNTSMNTAARTRPELGTGPAARGVLSGHLPSQAGHVLHRRG